MKALATQKQFYVFALCLPIIVMILVTLQLLPGKDQMFFILMWALGGGGYVTFALFALFRIRRKTDRELFWFSWKAPLYFTGIWCMVTIILAMLITYFTAEHMNIMSNLLDHNNWEILLTLAIRLLACGYIYVILMHIVRKLLSLLNLIGNPDVAS